MVISFVRQRLQAVPAPVFALFVYAIASGYAMSALPLLMPDGFLSMTVLTSWLTSFFYAGLLVGTLSSKRFIAKFGHKYSFILFQICFAVCLILLPFFQNQYFWLFDRFVAGFVVGGIFVAVESWLLKGTNEGRRKRLSIYMGMLYAGSALGQVALGFFGAHGAMPFVISACLSVLAAIALLVLPEYHAEVEDVSVTHSLPGRRRVKLAALMGCLISGMLLGTIYGMMPVQLLKLDMSQEEIGTLMAIIIVGAMVVQPIISLLSKKFGRTLLMGFFGLLGAASLGIFWQLMHELTMSMFVLGMAVFAFYPISINLGSSSVSQEHMVSASQQMLLTYSAGSILGPIVASHFMIEASGLFDFLFIVLITTSLYMLFASIKGTGDSLLVHK